LKEIFDKDLIEELWSECSSQPSENFIKALMSVEKLSTTHKEFCMEILKKNTLLIILKTKKRPYFEAECERIDQIRNLRLKTHALSTLNRGKNGIFFAGENHIRNLQLYCQTSPGFPYLCLVPRDEVSEQSVQESYQRICAQGIVPNPLDAPATGTEEAVTCAQTVQSLSSLKTEEELDQSLCLEAQIQRLLAFSVNDMDCGVNHYGLWDHRVDQLLNLELDRSTKNFKFLENKIKEAEEAAEKDRLECEIIVQALPSAIGAKEIGIILEYHFAHY